MFESVKKSLQFWIVIGLVAAFSFTCLSACGEIREKRPGKTNHRAKGHRPETC